MASPVPERASASPARSPPRPAAHDPAEAAIAANQATTIIEADEGFDDGYQTDHSSTRTTSLSSSVRDYTFENGRRYHKFREGLGDEYPSAQVPLNVKFLVDDAESPWIAQEDFYDLVHGRHITLAIKDFPTFIQRAFKHIKPGGWLEFQEMYYFPHCDDGTMPDSWPFLKFYEPLIEGLVALNVNLTIALEHTLNLERYGFTNIHHEVFKIPIGTWPKNKTLKTVGLYMRMAVLDGLDAMKEVQVYLVDVRKCLIDNSVHSYFPFHVSYRQKPENETKDE
ncbi:hypothetical protein BKA61DRAFT_645825 [Leptodontidium sp. MPI-SDFR-AT-0119]|nr:hypothetical protein BKA61DRAFT_645825 [Leptodontidium sp. MPI-SDFR-AT-0119]